MKKTKAKIGKSPKSPKIQPLADRILIQEEDVKQSKTDSGIYIPESVKEDRGSKRGKVIAVGKGRYDDGKLVPLGVSIGDTVLFQWGDKILLDGEEYYLVREPEVIAIIK